MARIEAKLDKVLAFIEKWTPMLERFSPSRVIPSFRKKV
jgi:hypothetical protein